MQKLLTIIMLLAGIITGFLIISAIVSQISWKIYTLIYTSYFWGLLFPHAKYKTIVFFVYAVFGLLIFLVIRIILKLRNH